MADFRTHITTSTVLGVGYGAAGYLAGLPADSCMLAGGMCSVAGMLPDLDSDSGIPFRESMAFAAAIIPMFMIDRFEHLRLSHESMILAAALIYITVRFGVAELFRRYTVHRGMWHSLPAALMAGLLAFVVCEQPQLEIRIFKSVAVLLGFLSHLVLDEIYSIQVRGGVRLKKSFGSALKLWSKSRWANISTYGKLVLLVAVAVMDPILMKHFDYQDAPIIQSAREHAETAQEQLKTAGNQVRKSILR